MNQTLKHRLERLERHHKPPLGPVIVWYDGETPPTEEECKRIEKQGGMVIHVEYVTPNPCRDDD